MSVLARRDAHREEQRPGPAERGLPNAWFIDPDHYRAEQERLFRRRWVLAGVEGQLPDPGTVYQTEVAGVPLILTRGRAGEIHAFQNVCPHRGVKLVSGNSTGQATITCPYHAWTYGLDGKLRTRAHFFGPGAHGTTRDEADHACEGLFKVRLARWNGALFINIDGEAEPFEDYVAPLEAEIEGYDLSVMEYGGSFTSRFEANWKLATENFLDSYHVFTVHPTLNSMMTNDQRKSSFGVGSMICSEFYSTDVGKDVRGGLPPIPGLPEEMANVSFFGVMFPNWMFSIHPAYLIHWHVIPEAVDRTRVDVHAHFVNGAATDEAHANARKKLLDYYEALNGEDESICRQLQEGRHAPAYDGGRFSPYWDGGTVHLANLIRQAMA